MLSGCYDVMLLGVEGYYLILTLGLILILALILILILNMFQC